MADSRMHDGEPEEFSLPYPATWTFAERIPKSEVDNYIRANHEQNLEYLPFEDVREQLAKIYFNANEKKLGECASPEEREKYYLAQQTIAKAIEKEKNGEDASRVNYRRRKDELVGVMQGPLSLASAQIVEQNAKALAAVHHVLNLEEDEKKEEELREFVRNSAKKFIQDNRE